MEATEKATNKQIQYLHVLYRKLGWDVEFYHAMLRQACGVSTSGDLTKEQACDFINKLHRIGEQLDERITQKQIYLVRELWKPIDYSHGEDDDAHLLTFIRKYYKKERLQDLTKHEGIKLIKQIGQMTKQAEERRGKTTVLRRHTKCVHCGELIMWVELKDGRRVAFDFDENKNPTDFHECDGSKE